MALFRMLCEDRHLAGELAKYLRPHHFEHGVLVWAFGRALTYLRAYGVFPGIGVLRHEARATIDAKLQPLYIAVLDQVVNTPIRDAEWLKNTALEFVRRSVFVSAFSEARDLYNQGRVEDSYTTMSRRLSEVFGVQWSKVERSWLAEDFRSRAREAQLADPYSEMVPTPFPRLNKILGGGLRLTELGIWVAYAKGGKSVMLINLGVSGALAFRNVLHFVFEGSLLQACRRYDSSFSGLLYSDLKAGRVSEEDVERAHVRYQAMRDKVVVRAFTDRWDCTALDIEAELRELKEQRGWVPELIIVDYGDLLHSRHPTTTTYEAQKGAFRDLKTLANRGYAVWTASQAQRPAKGDENKPHIIHARQIADCYEKVRVADFLGSINITDQERNEKVVRLFAELYRDNAANQIIRARCDFSKMYMWHEDGLDTETIPLMASAQQSRMA